MIATTTESSRGFFIVGGTMRPDAPSYILRQADHDLFEGLMKDEFCYVLTARQMGKSSLIIRTATRLRKEGVGVAVLDLTALGQNLSAEQWYGGLLVQIGQRLGVEDELMEIWTSQPLLGPLQRWMKALRSVVLLHYPGRLVIFIDEIDAVRSLPFSTDEFFAAIRECYNQRSEDREMERLTFCLSGVAAPSDLIRDTRTTPFNVGRRIELYDFTAGEAAALASGLERDAEQGASILRRILHWSGGHPYLTQAMCRAVSEVDSISNDAGVDDLCEQLFLSRRAQERDDNLLFVRERLLRSEVDQASLLELYERTRRGRTVYDDETNPLVNVLRLSGITRTEGGRLKVRNRIYARVFDERWTTANMPGADVRRQRKAFRRGVLRTSVVGGLILALVALLAFWAINQRDRAEKEAEARRRLLYFAQMKLAEQAWESANVDRVDEILDSQIPGPGEKDLRGFEWHLLRRLARGETFRRTGDYPIASVTFLPDNKTLVIGEVSRAGSSGNDEYLIKCYDSDSHRDVSSFQIRAGRNFNLVTFSPDKRGVAVDSDNFAVTMRDVISGQQLGLFPGHQQLITAIVFSPDSRQLLTASLDYQVKLWDVTSGRELRSIPMKDHWVTSAAFSPDGRTFVTTNDSQVVRMWDAASGRELPPIKSDDSALVRVCFFPDGRKLLTASQDGLLRIWDVRSRQLLTAVSGHTGYMEAFAFSPDAKMLATANDDRTVRVWSTANLRNLYTIRGHGSQVQCVAWSSDSKRIATGSSDRTVKIWDVARREPILPDEPVASYFATTFSSDNQLIALGSTRDGRVKLWNLSTGAELASFDEAGPAIRCAAFSRDNELLATGVDQIVKLWSVVTGRLIRVSKGHTGNVRSVDFSPDGKLLISGGEDRALKLWDVANGEELGSLQSDAGDNHYRAIFSPDGKNIASACRDGKVNLWDVQTMTVIRRFLGHTDRVRAIAFSLDGRRLATGGSDNTIRLWDVASGRELKKLGQSDIVNRAAFSMDGGYLVTGGFNNGSVKLWDVTIGEELITLEGHSDEVTSITFSKDGIALATSGSDGTVRLWRGTNNTDNAKQKE